MTVASGMCLLYLLALGMANTETMAPATGRRWRWAGLVLLALALGAAWTARTLRQWDRPFLLLLLGSDSRGGRLPSRSDAIFLLHIDPQHNTFRGLSLPRDLYVPIRGLPTNKTDRINSALFWGDYLASNGMAAARATIGSLLDLPIDGTVLVQFQFIKKLVDALGGIEVYCDNPAYDFMFGDIHAQHYRYVRFESGWNFLDGDRALEYIRIRKPDYDFGRMKRNRQLLSILESKLKTTDGLKRALRISPSLWEEIKTDLDGLDYLRLLWVLHRTPAREVLWSSIPPAGIVPFVTPKGAQVLVLQPGVVEEAHDELLGLSPPPRRG